MVGLSSLVSTGATLPVGQALLTDDINVGGSTGIREVIALGRGVAGSTQLLPSSSGSALDGHGLQVNVVNSTAAPIGVVIHAGQSSVTISGNSTAIISTASKIVADISTASKILAELTGGKSTVTVEGTVAVTDNAGSLTVDFTTASKAIVELSTTGMGGSTASPMWVSMHPIPLVQSTYFNGKITSTTAVVALSSAASTRFVITAIDIVNEGATPTEISIFDGSSAGTLLYRQWASSAGGGISRTFSIPRYGTTGSSVSVQINPASTVYVTFDAYRSS